MASNQFDYQEEMRALDEQRVRALADGDYRTYALLCDECGVVDNQEAYERGVLDMEQDRTGRCGGRLESMAKKSVPRKKRQIKPELVPKYIELYERARSQGLNPDNLFEQVPQKTSLYSAVMYDKLIAGEGERVQLWDAKETRVASAFRDAYYRGKRLSEEGRRNQ